MKGGGFNADSSLISDGRRANPRKCRDCDNAVRTERSRLCSDCDLRIFESRQKINRAAAAKSVAKKQAVARTPIDNLSGGLTGLQYRWFGALFMGEVQA